MKPTEIRELTATKLQRITWLSSRDRNKCFSNLMHLFNEESLEDCFREMDRNKAIGIDQISKEEYGNQYWQIYLHIMLLMNGFKKW